MCVCVFTLSCPLLFVQLSSALEKLAQLKGQQYGEVSLEAGNILRLAKAAPFEGRLAALSAVSSVVSCDELGRVVSCVV